MNVTQGLEIGKFLGILVRIPPALTVITRLELNSISSFHRFPVLALCNSRSVWIRSFHFITPLATALF
jgi:hypothetical protein